MKTLFLKYNLLHIRTNEGEFEVSNPEEFEAAWIPLGVTIEQYFKSFEGTDHPEWPGGIELIELPSAKVLGQRGHTNVIKGKKLARLLPQEKKDDIQPKRWEESTSIPSESDYKEEFKPAQPTPNFPKGGTTFTESAYKEFEGNCSKCGHPLNPATAGYQCTNINCPAVEASEPQEKEPTAYQKRKAIEKRAVWLKYCLDIGWTKDQLDGLEKIWDQHHDESGNLIKGVSAPSESQEEMYNEVRQEYLKHRGRIWTKEEVMLKWIIENYKLITRNP